MSIARHLVICKRCLVDEVAGRIDPSEVAARLRAVVQLDDQEDVSAVARRLVVDEHVLRDSLRASPRLDVGTLAAVVREFGIDPSWLLTGEYDSTTHHLALDDDKTQSASAVIRFITTQLSRASYRAPRAADLSDNS
jgi:hypothetical protein